MFNRYTQKNKTAENPPAKELTLFSKPAVILADERRVQLLQQIELFFATDQDNRFQTHAYPLLANLINHVQLLPETSNSYYSQAGGLLDHALNRTEAALDLFRQFIVVDEQSNYSEEQKLWQYALYSASLLQGIGKLCIDFSISRYDKNGQSLEAWNPLLDALVAEGAAYHYQFEKDVEIEFRRRLNLLIARLLMPENGFTWIASDPQVLAVWLALLNEDYHGAGTLGAILIRANAISIRRYFERFLILERSKPIRSRVSTFSGGVPESVEDLSTKVGAEFLKWLQDAIASGELAFNQPPLLMVTGGLLVSSDIFKRFAKTHAGYQSWIAVQNGFLSLGLHQVGPNGEVDFRVESPHDHAMMNGIVFSEFGVVLPDQINAHQAQTGNLVTLSATELIHQAEVNPALARPITTLPYLAASGTWDVSTNAQNVAAAGMKSRG